MRKRLRVWVRQRKDRPGKPWYCQWELPGGGRDTQTFGPGKENHDAADAFAAAKEIELAQLGGGAPKHDPRITVETFSAYWLQLGRAGDEGWKPRTKSGYADMLRQHVLPIIGKERMRSVTAQDACDLLANMLRNGYAVGTVRYAYSTSRRMFKRAVFDGVIASNPFAGVWHELPISVKKRVMGKRRTAEDVKAMTADQVRALLRAAREIGTPEGRSIWTPLHRDYVLLLLMARCGLRLGEALGLQLDDLDLDASEIVVRRTLGAPKKGRTLEDRVGSTKGDRERRVDLGPEIRAALRRHLAARLEQNLKNGWARERAPWVFVVPETGTPLSEFNVRRSFETILGRAALPEHFTPHCLRHTFATLMLRRGAPLVWVSRQLGHADVNTTLLWYAWALPEGDKTLAALLDESESETKSNLAADSGGEGGSDGR